MKIGAKMVPNAFEMRASGGWVLKIGAKRVPRSPVGYKGGVRRHSFGYGCKR